MKHRLIFAAMLAATMALPAQGFEWPWAEHDEAPPPPPRPVVTEIVSASNDLARSVPGVIAARTQVTLGFQTLGRLVARDVDIGDQVAAGQVIARLDPEDLTGNVRAAQASRDAAQVQLSTAMATAERVRALAARNVTSKAQLEQAEQALAAAKATADQTESELLRAQDAAGFAEIAAPFAGVISAVYETPGAVVQAGAPIVQLSAENEAEAVIDLPETTLASLPENPVFEVWEESSPDASTPAALDRIEPLADSATRTRRLHLTLNDPAGFRLGALIRARLSQDESASLSLPDLAILDRDGPHVWRVSRSGDNATVSLTPVETGVTLHQRTQIISGLSAGDEVVIRGIHSLTDGQAVGRRVAP